MTEQEDTAGNIGMIMASTVLEVLFDMVGPVGPRYVTSFVRADHCNEAFDICDYV